MSGKLWAIAKRSILLYNIYWLGIVLTLLLVAQIVYGNWASNFSLLYNRVDGLNETRQRIDNWITAYGIEHEDAAGLWETYFRQEKVVRQTYQSLPSEASYKTFGSIVNSRYYILSRQALAALFIALILIQEFVKPRRDQKFAEPPLAPSFKKQ